MMYLLICGPLAMFRYLTVSLQMVSVMNFVLPELTANLSKDRMKASHFNHLRVRNANLCATDLKRNRGAENMVLH